MKISATSQNDKNINFSMQIKDKNWWLALNQISGDSVQSRLLIKEAESLADEVEEEILKSRKSFASAFEKVSRQKKYREMDFSTKKDISEVLKFSWLHGEKIPKSFYDQSKKKRGFFSFLADFL